MNHSSLSMSACVRISNLIIDMAIDEEILEKYKEVNEGSFDV